MITGRTFELSHFGAPPLKISNLSFHKCFFDNCTLSQPTDPQGRSIIQNVSLVQCKQRGCGLDGAILDNVTVDRLGREGRIPLFLPGVVFRHVTLKGRITFFKLQASPFLEDPERNAQWVDANRSFYESVDWALDISETIFTWGPDLHFVPGSLIRRDPETQVLVTRRALEGVALASLPWQGSSHKTGLEWFLQDGPYEDVVLVAAKGTTYFEQDLAAIRMLQERGIAKS